MINKKSSITILLVLAFLLIVYSALFHTQHGNKEVWLKKHAAVVKRNKNPQQYCIKCHEKQRGETEANYCNVCHEINAGHKDKAKWYKEHGTVAASNPANTGKFCLDCHTKTREETRDKYCNECHKKNNVPLIK